MVRTRTSSRGCTTSWTHLEEGIHGAGGELGEGRVRGGEHRQLVAAGEGTVKLGGHDGGHQGVVGARALGGLDDVLGKRGEMGQMGVKMGTSTWTV